MSMTPEQKVKFLILVSAAEMAGESAPDFTSLTGAQIDADFEALSNEDVCWDATSAVREGEVETSLPCEWSRHYESKAVAAKLPDGSWVGWTYWYGGGKHGEPEAVDWMEEAYDLACVEEEKMITVRTFTKVEGGAA